MFHRFSLVPNTVNWKKVAQAKLMILTSFTGLKPIQGKDFQMLLQACSLTTEKDKCIHLHVWQVECHCQQV